MRTHLPLAALALAALAACKDNVQPAPIGASPGAQPASSAPAAAGGTLSGKVTEKIDAAQYTYLKLQTAQGEQWAAVPQTATAVGTTVTVLNPMWMKDFKSQTLDRTWDRIAFGTLQGEGAAQGQAQLPPGHPPTSGGQGAMPPGHPSPSSASDVGEVKVPKAAGPDGRTVADVYAQKASLKGQKVAVRGKVVKVTNGVMGKNWLHLRDGSGAGSTADLTVSSEGTAAMGDIVTVTGVVHLDRDLGAGYHYDVLLEDAQVQK
jgi:hypothetical protein